jgi:hypothetical protein
MVAVQIAADIIGDSATHGEDVPTMEACIEQARVAALDGAIDTAPHERVRPVRFADAVGAMFSEKDIRERSRPGRAPAVVPGGPCVGSCESDRV